MKIYVDNNIIVGIENGEFDMQDFLSIPNTEYYYSCTHIDELLEAQDIPSVSVPRRLNTIQQLCQNHGILKRKKGLEFMYLPSSWAYIISTNYGVVKSNNSLKKHIVKHNIIRNIVIKLCFGVKRHELNKIVPEAVFSKLNQKMITRMNWTIEEYYGRYQSHEGMVFYMLLDLLNRLDFHKDKETEHSSIARMYDASHADHARICDVFLTDDKKLIQKTKAIYKHLKIGTQVMRPIEFLNSSVKQTAYSKLL